jgi:hypothetical protein
MGGGPASSPPPELLDDPLEELLDELLDEAPVEVTGNSSSVQPPRASEPRSRVEISERMKTPRGDAAGA